MPPKRIKKPPVQPDPNRIPTRPKNAATHPGEVHTQCSNRRPESVIQAEKAEKAAKRARKEQKIIKQDEAAEAIAEYEQDMVINDTAEDAQFPRHRDKADPSRPVRVAGHRSTSGTKRKIEGNTEQYFEIVENSPEVDSSVEEQPKSKRTRVGVDAARHNDLEAMEVESDGGNTARIPGEDSDPESELTEAEETPKPKRVHHNTGPGTLRRTETYIELDASNENPGDDIWMLEPEGVEELEYYSPKPNEEKMVPRSSSEYHTDLEEDEDGSVFVSPLKANKKRAPVADSDGELTGTENGHSGLNSKGKGKKTDTGKRPFREMVQEKRMTTTTTNNKRALIKPAGGLKATFLSSESSRGDNGTLAPIDGNNIIDNDGERSTFVNFQSVQSSKKKTQQLKTLKVTPTQSLKVISYRGEDDRMHKSLSHQAEDTNNGSAYRSLQNHSESSRAQKFSHSNRDTNSDLQTHDNRTQLVDRVSKATDDAPAKLQQVKKASKTQDNNISQSHPAPNVPKTANKSETSRTTANNPVSVTKAPDSKAPASKKKTTKPDSITVAIKTTNGNVSGDEDQKERDDMLASPVKGSDARSASTGLVKLEKTTNEKPKNRSKAELLQLKKEDLITWNSIIEPNYIKYYLSTKSLWSADAKLLEIAQLLYDETLGSKKSLILTTSSGPIKLLNQKLNDVRNQTGKIAITNLDASFLEMHGSDSLQDYTPKSVANMRIKFAQNLLEGYQFLFGPDTEFDDGSTTRGKRFFNPLILQTFASVFKHTVGTTPPSFPKIGHPIAALALACVSVERAIRIWAEGIYDANTGKIIAKINPLSNKPSKETAFSSTIWADATNKYVMKIATLKDDVWMELMDKAATYMAFTWENFTAGNSLAASDPHATDRDRALFSDDE